MQDPPTREELLAAVGALLRDELIPRIEDPGLRFRARIAANLLAIAGRERELGPRQAKSERQRLAELLDSDPESASLESLTRQLHERVAAGEFDQGPQRQRLMAHLQATAVEKLRIANPKYLARLEIEAEEASRSAAEEE